MTTRKLVLNPIFVPVRVPTFVTQFCDNPSSLSGSIFIQKFCCSNFCDHPSAQVCDHCRTNFCRLHLVHFAVSRHQLTTRISSVHLTLNNLLRALDCTVLEQVAAVPTVVPLVPMLGQATNLFSVCASPVVSVIPTRVRPVCAFLTGLCCLFVFELLQFVKSFLPFLAVVFTLSCVFVLAFALAFVVLAFARAGLAFGFVVGGRPSSMDVLQVFGFHSTVSRPVSVISTP